jgi:hypothetical protein
MTYIRSFKEFCKTKKGSVNPYQSYSLKGADSSEKPSQYGKTFQKLT